jgi:hypothetical protein
MRTMILASAAAAAAAVALAITGAATATTNTKTEHFSFIQTQTSGNENLYSAIATGGVTDGGTALAGKGTATLRFSRGTIKLATKHGQPHSNANLKLCLETYANSGTYTILSGTGAYKGISGSGKYTLHTTDVGPIINGKCSTTANGIADQGIIIASGPVSLP